MFKENNLENSMAEVGQEEYSSRIVLKFMRHDEKSKVEPGQPDERVKLTEKGRKHARGLSKFENMPQTVGFGSPFDRAQETAGQVMAGDALSLTGEEPLSDLKNIIDADLKYGTKLGVDSRLGFFIDKSTEYGKAANDAFGKGQWLPFLTEKSDELAQESGDDKSSTYSRMAAGVAEIVNKYLAAAPRFDSLVKDKGYEKDLNRFFVSHQGVLESFLAKIVEKTQGKQELGYLIKALNNQGFAFAEGFEMDIEMQNGEPKIKVSYKKEGEHPFKFHETVSEELLKEIIYEGDKK